MTKINKKLILSILSIALVAILFTACKDNFTEEDALNAQQTVTYNVILLDVASQTGVEGAEVTIIQDGSEVKITTNDLGAATFKNVKIGSDFPVVVSKEGYAPINTTADGIYADYRQAEVSNVFYTLSMTENLATVKGKVEIETDLTNDSREKVTSGTVKAYFNADWYGNYYIPANFVVEGTIQSDGTYELQLPTFGSGVNYDIVASDLELDQKIAYNKKVGEPNFPQTLPKIETVKTVFSDGSGAASFPTFVPAVFAVVGTSQTANSAVLNVETAPDGTIDFVGVFSSGSGYPASTTVPVTITSLLTGSGATANANTNASGQVTSVTITNAGSGYPEEFYDTPDAVLVGGTSSASNLSNNLTIKPNDLKINNLFYGTGSARPFDIQ